MKSIIDNKQKVICTAVLFVSMVFGQLAYSGSGGSYVLEWSTLDSGGGQSSGGSYVLTGTIGQADAAYSEGGDYEVLGGFWPGGPLCFVDLAHFARFASDWMEMGFGLPGDLYEDENNVVDGFDLDVFLEEWLSYCRLDWKLR